MSAVVLGLIWVRSPLNFLRIMRAVLLACLPMPPSMSQTVRSGRKNTPSLHRCLDLERKLQYTPVITLVSLIMALTDFWETLLTNIVQKGRKVPVPRDKSSLWEIFTGYVEMARYVVG
ncbi:hypothetical protein GDO78_016971 [Eleutherodactylus coqui]|uniref:Uncharacterized protein n=1 Tax=Eleutherodactylus coqui TaxID=57060 RepID=A0A8J6BAM6_ELECQ|nr:hypothetical protein GDO78_016971 [Eleutherodactylus coqui]